MIVLDTPIIERVDSEDVYINKYPNALKDPKIGNYVTEY